MMKEQLPNNDIDSLAALDELGELIMKTGVTSEQLVEEHLKEKYAKCMLCILFIFAHKKTIKRTQYEETFLIHDIAGATVARQCV